MSLQSHKHSYLNILNNSNTSFINDLKLKYDNYYINKQNKISYIMERKSNKGVSNGYVPLDDNIKIPNSNI